MAAAPDVLRSLARQLRELADQADAIAGLTPATLPAAPTLVSLPPVRPVPLRVAADEPPWLARARRDIGVHETPGVGTHPRIAAYYRAAGLDPGTAAEPRLDDSTTAWCACAVSAWVAEEGLPLPRFPFRARSWATWGRALAEPMAGCVVVFSRGDNPAQGHVGLWVGRDGRDELVLGGNQSNSVSIGHRPISSVLAGGYRWPVTG